MEEEGGKRSKEEKGKERSNRKESEGVIVNRWKPSGLAPMGYAPPITSDPPFHADARRLLLNPETTLAELPDMLLQRLRDPNWSVPVITSAAQLEAGLCPAHVRAWPDSTPRR